LTPFNRADRDVRQRDLVPPARLAAVHAVVVGVGAVGRQVALQLAAMGVTKMTLIDPDIVSVENLAPQGFPEAQVGLIKVNAVKETALTLNPAMGVTPLQELFRRSFVKDWDSARPTAVFACVDSIDARRLVWESVRSRTAFFADGRVAAEVIRVLASDRPHQDTAYPRTLFRAGEAHAGSCTAKMTIYTANIAAGLMVAQFARWLRDQPVVADQTLNLLAAELTVAEAA
jgi:molybdopterin-synthase adenylyltransferase